MSILEGILTMGIITLVVIINNLQYEYWKKTKFGSWLFFTLYEAAMIIFLIISVYSFLQG